MPKLDDLPAPDSSRKGWPWTERVPDLGATRSDGQPWPLITLVTPSYNQAQFLEETLRSVLLQGYPNLEYFVIDGGSSDESIDIIQRYSPWLTYWHSKKDLGQPDAINFALRRASGIWFHNINSDDVLDSGALAEIGNAPISADFVFGNVMEFTGGSQHLVRNVSLNPESLLINLARSDTSSWHQPGVVFKTENLRTIGGYTTKLQYVFDLHTTVKYLERFSNGAPLDRVLVNFRIHEAQKSTAWGAKYTHESILCRHLLADELLTQPLRVCARREARRRELMREISGLAALESSSQSMSSIWRIIADEPSLVLNRMLLGYIRRHPLAAVKSLLQKP